MKKTERWMVGALLSVALLMFFFPLVTLHVPIVGSQELSGYDLFSRAREISHSLASLPVPGHWKSPGKETATIPTSVSMVILIPVEIIAGFTCALIGLLCCFSPFRTVSAKPAITIGAVVFLLAIVQIRIANSDLHNWFLESTPSSTSDSPNGTIAGVAKEIGNLAASATQFSPGIGLYVLTGALLITTVLLFSGVLSAIPSAHDSPAPVHSGEHKRALAVLVLLALFVILAIFVQAY